VAKIVDSDDERGNDEIEECRRDAGSYNETCTNVVDALMKLLVLYMNVYRANIQNTVQENQ